MRRLFLVSAICLFFLFVSCADNGGNESDDPQNGDTSAKGTFSPDEDGELVLDTEAGDRLTLTIPAGALTEETDISVTWLSTPRGLLAQRNRFRSSFRTRWSGL